MAKQRRTRSHALTSVALAAAHALLDAELRSMRREEVEAWIHDLMERAGNQALPAQAQREANAMLVGILTVATAGARKEDRPNA